MNSDMNLSVFATNLSSGGIKQFTKSNTTPENLINALFASSALAPLFIPIKIIDD